MIITVLSEVICTVKGKKPKILEIGKDKYHTPYIDIKAFEKKTFRQYTDGIDCVRCNNDDILVVWDGARCGLVGRGVSGAVGSTIAKINCYDLSKDYVFYFLQTKYDEINKRPKGVGIPHVNPNVFWNIPIPIPPLPEQKRIVKKIEELFKELDEGAETLKKMQGQLKQYRQSVLKSAFEGKLTENWRKKNKPVPASVLLEKIKEERKKKDKKYKELPPIDTTALFKLPNGWLWANIGNLGNIITGTTPSKNKSEYYGKDYAFFKPSDLDYGYYTIISGDGLSKAGIKEARLLPEKSILVTCIGATIGKTGFIRVKGTSNQQINAIVPNNNIIPEYVYFMCISPQFQRCVIENSSSTTLPILNKGNFEILPMPVMSRIEQQQIVKEIESRFAMTDELEKTIEQSLKQAETLRQSILKLAFEGKLVSQDPNDEPVEKLLERIKKEKDKTN